MLLVSSPMKGSGDILFGQAVRQQEMALPSLCTAPCLLQKSTYWKTWCLAITLFPRSGFWTSGTISCIWTAHLSSSNWRDFIHYLWFGHILRSDPVCRSGPGPSSRAGRSRFKRGCTQQQEFRRDGGGDRSRIWRRFGPRATEMPRSGQDGIQQSRIAPNLVPQ